MTTTDRTAPMPAAARVFGAADALSASELAHVSENRSPVQRELGEAAFSRLFTEGANMTAAGGLVCGPSNEGSAGRNCREGHCFGFMPRRVDRRSLGTGNAKALNVCF